MFSELAGPALPVKFTTLSIQAVKSISQRGMLLHWSELALAAGRRFPAFSDLHIGRVIDPKSLMIWSIERSGDQRTFRSLYHGAWMAEAFHGDWVGKTMEEMVPEGLRTYALDAAKECVNSGCAIFTILSTRTAEGHRVDCERLLLPFGRAGEVECLVGSMQLISFEGDFQRRNVLNDYQKTATVELAGRIPANYKRLAVEAEEDCALVVEERC